MGNIAVTILAILALLVGGAVVYAISQMIFSGSKSGDTGAKVFAWGAAVGLLFLAVKVLT